MPQQIIVLHGGDTFDTYEAYIADLKSWVIDFDGYKSTAADWKRNLATDLGEQYDVILPAMPNKANAKYLEWKILFDKLVPFFQPGVILIGHSLGGTFLAKYVSENTLPVPIKAMLLVAPPFDDKDADYSLADFVLPEDLSNISKQTNHIFLYHSEDDPVVPFVDASKFKTKLPELVLTTFKDRGHIRQQHLPEVVEAIQQL